MHGEGVGEGGGGRRDVVGVDVRFRGVGVGLKIWVD